MTEWGQRMLRCRGRQLSEQSIATDLRTSCGLQISSRTVRRELHGMGIHDRAAASKPYITKCNAKRQMQWCKARCRWTLEQLFFRSWTWPLNSSERNSECFSIPRDFGPFHAPNIVEIVWGWPLPIPVPDKWMAPYQATAELDDDLII